MKKIFVKRISLFLFILLALLCIFHFAMDQLVVKDMSVKNYWLLGKKGNHYDALVLGSSRTHGGINVCQLKDSLKRNILNMSLEGTGYPEQYMMLSLFLRENSSKVLVLNVDVYSILRGFFSHPYHEYYYLPLISDSTVYANLKAYYGYKAVLWKYIPFYKYVDFNRQIGLNRLIKMYSSKNQEAYEKYQGTLLVNGSLKNVSDQQLVKNINTFLGEKNSISDTNIVYLKKIIHLAKQHNMQVMMVMLPEYHKVYAYQPSRKKIVSLFTSIAQTTNSKFYNFENHVTAYDITKLYNYSHLNAQGATVFTADFVKFFKPYVNK